MMPKNFLMIINITGVVALSYVICYYFQGTCSFQGSSVKKKLMYNI